MTSSAACHPRKTAVGILFLMLFIAAGVSACTGPPKQAVPPGDLLFGLIRFYQGPLNHLSAVRRGECPMSPSCSEYARLAVATYGPLIGWVMAHDRLLRCGRDEISNAPRVLVNGQWKVYDPPEANTFWWRQPAGEDPHAVAHAPFGETRRPAVSAR